MDCKQLAIMTLDVFGDSGYTIVKYDDLGLKQDMTSLGMELKYRSIYTIQSPKGNKIRLGINIPYILTTLAPSEAQYRYDRELEFLQQRAELIKLKLDGNREYGSAKIGTSNKKPMGNTMKQEK